MQTSVDSFTELKREWRQVCLMTSWEGFTDRDLQRLKKGAQQPLALETKEGDALRSALRQNNSRKGLQALSNTSKTRANMVLSSPNESSNLPSEAFICQSASALTETDDKTIQTSKAATDRNGASANSHSVPSSSLHLAQTPEGPDHCSKGEDLTPTGQSREDQNEVNLTDQPATSLDTLQKKQKEIEEENQKKKALLHQVLAERYKRTAVESQTLAAVKKELEKIDTVLSNDVLILRDKIEEVNRKFEFSRKRFEHAESEYVAAKLELHRAAEAKELLAEHLCSIIQQNEMRKANKLAELMTTLNLGETAADGGLTSPGSEGANACDMKFFQRTPTPAIHRSQLPKLQSPPAVPPESSSLSPKAELPLQHSPISDTPAPSVSSTDSTAAQEEGHHQQQHVTGNGTNSSTANNESRDGNTSAGDQDSQTGAMQATHVQHIQ